MHPKSVEVYFVVLGMCSSVVGRNPAPTDRELIIDYPTVTSRVVQDF